MSFEETNRVAHILTMFMATIGHLYTDHVDDPRLNEALAHELGKTVKKIESVYEERN